MQADEYCNELEVTIFDSITEATVLSRNTKEMKTREEMISDLRIHLEDIEERLPNISQENEALEEQVSYYIVYRTLRLGHVFALFTTTSTRNNNFHLSFIVYYTWLYIYNIIHRYYKNSSYIFREIRRQN